MQHYDSRLRNQGCSKAKCLGAYLYQKAARPMDDYAVRGQCHMCKRAFNIIA